MVIFAESKSAFHNVSVDCTSIKLHYTSVSQHCYGVVCTRTLIQQYVNFYHIEHFGYKTFKLNVLPESAA